MLRPSSTMLQRIRTPASFPDRAGVLRTRCLALGHLVRFLSHLPTHLKSESDVHTFVADQVKDVNEMMKKARRQEFTPEKVRKVGAPADYIDPWLYAFHDGRVLVIGTDRTKAVAIAANAPPGSGSSTAATPSRSCPGLGSTPTLRGPANRRRALLARYALIREIRCPIRRFRCLRFRSTTRTPATDPRYRSRCASTVL